MWDNAGWYAGNLSSTALSRISNSILNVVYHWDLLVAPTSLIPVVMVLPVVLKRKRKIAVIGFGNAEPPWEREIAEAMLVQARIPTRLKKFVPCLSNLDTIWLERDIYVNRGSDERKSSRIRNAHRQILARKSIFPLIFTFCFCTLQSWRLS